MSEKQFATSLETVFRHTKGFYYMAIPDIIVTREMLDSASSRGRLTARKLPCDGILITPLGAICIELKYAYGQLKPHQIANCVEANLISPCSYLVLREKKNRYYIEHHSEKSREVLTECDSIADLPHTIMMLQGKAKLLKLENK